MRETQLERYLDIEHDARIRRQQLERDKQFHAVLDYLGVELLQDENGNWRVVKK